LKNIITNAILILLFIITCQVVAAPTFHSVYDNFAQRYNTTEEEQTPTYKPHLNNIQYDCNLTNIYDISCKNNNISGFHRIPEPNTIILGGVGTFIVLWMKRSKLL
jgi:hypothetical protein